MSIIQAANIHFESTGTQRIVYSGGKINLISSGEIEIPEHLNVNGINVKSSISEALGAASAAFDSANNVAPQLAPSFNTANAAFNTANSALPNTSGVSFAGNLNFPSGNVGIGRTNADYLLDVNGTVNVSAIFVNGSALSSGATLVSDSDNATRFMVFSSSNTGSMTQANVSTALTYNPSTGTLSSTLFNSTSDINKKENVIQVTDALNILYQIDGVRFTWKDNGLPSLGVIAQQVEKVLPEIVESEKSVNYNGLIAVLIEAVKELKAEIEELKKNR